MAKQKVPSKYTRGLKESTAQRRETEIRKRMSGKRSESEKYKPLPGDKKAETRPSRYTLSLSKMRQEISEAASKMKGKQDDRFVSAVAKVTGIPRGIIDQVFKKGQAAWAVGHRPGLRRDSGPELGSIPSFRRETLSRRALTSIFMRGEEGARQKREGDETPLRKSQVSLCRCFVLSQLLSSFWVERRPLRLLFAL